MDEFQGICIMMKHRDILHHQLYHMKRVGETHYNLPPKLASYQSTTLESQ